MSTGTDRSRNGSTRTGDEQRFHRDPDLDGQPPAPDEDVVPPLVRKLERRRERYRGRPLWFRSLWVVAGFLVLLAGIAMLITPGPALLLIPIGLAMLAQQFDWAQGALERSLAYARRANAQARETSPLMKALAALATAVAVGGFVFWAYAGDVPILPV